MLSRYDFFIHVTAEMVQSVLEDNENERIDSVMDDADGWENGKNFVLLVSLSDVETRDGERREQDDPSLDELDEEGNCSKKIRGVNLFDLYMELLLDPFDWDLMYSHKELGYHFIP